MINKDCKIIGVYLLEEGVSCIHPELKKRHLIVPNKIITSVPKIVITGATSEYTPVFQIQLDSRFGSVKLSRCVIYSYDECDREKYPDIDIQKDIVSSMKYLSTLKLYDGIKDEEVVSEFNSSGGLMNLYNRANESKNITVRFLNNNGGSFSSPSYNSYTYLISKKQLCSIIYELNEKKIKLVESVGDINNYNVASFRMTTSIGGSYKNLVYIEDVSEYDDSYYQRPIVDEFVFDSKSLVYKPGLNLTADLLKKNLHLILASEEENIIPEEEERKENPMKSNVLFKDIQFGRAMGVVMSIYGPAFPTAENEDEYIAYSKKDDEWIDVSPMIFDRDIALFYAMPVAKDNLSIGDFIFHNGGWVRVIDFDQFLRPVVETPKTKTVNTILATKNMFGFDFYTKLVSPFGDMMDCASADKPFGNILPFMLLQDSNSADLLPMLLLSQGGKLDTSNPMMLYFLMKDGKNFDILPFLMMGMMNK